MRSQRIATVVAALLVGACGSSSDTTDTVDGQIGSSRTESPGNGTPGDGRETWEGETLDGERVVIVEGEGGPRFVDGRPSPLTLIDEAAAAGGCDALQLELNYWEAQAAPTEDGRRASAFAKYAQDERAELGC
jgi:hypothetical protein